MLFRSKVAYEAVQRAAMRTWKEKVPLAQTLAEEPEVAAKLTAEDVAEACSLDHHFKHVDAKFRAVGLE